MVFVNLIFIADSGWRRRLSLMTKIIKLNREKEAFEKAINAINTLPIEQIVVVAKYSDRAEEVFFYGNPKENYMLLALAQFQVGSQYPLTQPFLKDHDLELE
jgi:hypothetical protein